MEFTDQNFEREVLNSDIPVLVDFWASWCPPCKMMEPVVDQLTEEFRGRVKIGTINVDRNPLTRERYNIAGVPTFILIKDTRELDRKVAAAPIVEMRRFIESAL